MFIDVYIYIHIHIYIYIIMITYGIYEHHVQPPGCAVATGEKILHLRSQDPVQSHQRTLSNWVLSKNN